EIPCKFQLLDETQLSVQLAPHAIGNRPVAFMRSFCYLSAQERNLRFSTRHRVFWEFIAQFFERKFELCRELRSISDCFWKILKDLDHLLAGADMALPIDLQALAGFIKSALLLHAGKRI